MARVLVVEDEEAPRLAPRQLLDQMGHEFLEARNGREGLQQYRAAVVDLVITNLVMPEMDGPGLIRSLQHEAPGVKIIVLSRLGPLAQPHTEIARRFGVQHGLRKPVDPVQRQQAVQDLRLP